MKIAFLQRLNGQKDKGLPMPACWPVIFFIMLGSSSSFSTQSHLYSAFAPAPNQKAPMISAREEGYCLQSTLSKRSNAYRCVTDKHSFDPCFMRRYGNNKQAICPKAPWLSRVTMIELENLPTHSNSEQELDMSQQLPWAIQLLDGSHCLLKKNGYYQCDDNSTLQLPFSRCATPWKIIKLDKNNHFYAKVQMVWF